MRLSLALLADVGLAAALSAAQFMILYQMQLAFTADHALLYFGSPLAYCWALLCTYYADEARSQNTV